MGAPRLAAREHRVARREAREGQAAAHLPQFLEGHPAARLDQVREHPMERQLLHRRRPRWGLGDLQDATETVFRLREDVHCPGEVAGDIFSAWPVQRECRAHAPEVGGEEHPFHQADKQETAHPRETAGRQLAGPLVGAKLSIVVVLPAAKNPRPRPLHGAATSSSAQEGGPRRQQPGDRPGRVPPPDDARRDGGRQAHVDKGQAHWEVRPVPDQGETLQDPTQLRGGSRAQDGQGQHNPRSCEC
mmetsp:Transcript_105092/g.322145  ORF Transcript_105092/g.322145 Transcript_105092/m.322145 type:complete len:245 (-) Transcript_105092:296-1030(-)